MIPYSCQNIDEDDIKAVSDVLKSEYLTQGPCVPEFENQINEFVGSKFSIAVSSATAALHLACMALGVSKGDIVWTSAISYVASSNCALYCDATIDFVDIDPETNNLSIDALSQKLLEAKENNMLPKVLIPVHLSGQPCDMKDIFELSIEYDFKIIEDASHAIGATYKDSKIGDCFYSDITVFSFHPVKMITTCEGGAALTKCSQLAEKLFLLRSHGVTKDPHLFQNISDGPWYYEQQELGFNYRMTDLHAALGISQIKKLQNFLIKRLEVADYYRENLINLPISLPNTKMDRTSSWHLYIIRINSDQTKKTHKEVFQHLIDSGIGVNLHYIPIYKHPYYQSIGFKDYFLKETEHFYSEAISLPIHTKLEPNDLDSICSELRNVFTDF
jgi:UDP-4-amino-4,6-dideoxy-N-acetyl-beta-L-altrosamine transaminase